MMDKQRQMKKMLKDFNRLLKIKDLRIFAKESLKFLEKDYRKEGVLDETNEL